MRNPETLNPAGVKHPHNGGGKGGGGSAPVSGGGGLAESYQESSGGNNAAAASTVATNTTSYTPSTPTAKAPKYAAPTPTISSYTSAGATTTVNLKPLMSTITDPATRALASSAISNGLKYEVNPSLLIASASVTDYGRKGSGKGYTNLGDGSETGRQSIRQAAKYLSEVGFHDNPQQAITALAKRAGADPEQLRKIASGYTALDDAARKIETAPGDTQVTGVGRFKYRKPEDRPGARAAINAATKAGQAATKKVHQQAAAERNNPFDTTFEQARKQQRQGDLPAPTAALKARDAGKAATAEVEQRFGRSPLQAARIAAISGRGATARVESIVGNPAGPNPRKVAGRLKKAVAKSQGQVPDYVPEQYRGLIADASSKSGVPAGLLSALLQQESGFQAHIGSPAGAQGIAQFMPETASSRGVNPNDPASAIPGAADLLAENKKQFGSWELALAAYNAGGGAVSQYGGIPPYPETQNYVKTIMANAGNTDPAKDVSGKLISTAQDVLGKQRTNKILNAPGGAPTKPLSGADIGRLRGPRDQIEQFKTMLKVAQRIDASGKDYVWGGGHVSGKIPGIGKASGYDCSGFTSKVLQAAGVPGLQAGALTSGAFGNVEGLAPGPGAVSIFYNDGHVFMRIGDKYFGTSSSGAPGGGSTGSGGLMTEEAGASQVNSGEFNVVHVASLEGLKGAKVATKGLKMAPDGTTATMTGSQPVGAPGPSSLPPTPNGMLSPQDRATVNAAAGVSGGVGGSIASAAAAYARKSLSGGDTGDPIYDAFRPRR